MESVGWLDSEPTLKPMSEQNPDGFDYDKNITVLDGDTLEFEGGGVLKLATHYEPAECEHLTTVYVPDLNGFFASDFCYSRVHLWMGAGVTDVHIQNWREQLEAFKAEYRTRGYACASPTWSLAHSRRRASAPQNAEPT